MIALMFRTLRWRFLVLALLAVAIFFLEPGFHQHEEFDSTAVALGPVGISASLSYFAGLAMIILFAGTVSTDRREGYTRLLFAHSTSPLAYYGLRWVLAYAIAVGGALAFLVFGQLIAWGEFLGGWQGMLLPLLSALIYGGLIAFLSTLLPRSDGWIAFLLFLPTLLPQLLNLALQNLAPALRQTIVILLPPQTALQDIWEGLLLESIDWGAVLFAAAYGTALLIAASMILRLREWS